MFGQILDLLKSPVPAAAPPDMHIAVAVLLIEAAMRDDSFSLPERAVIARLLATRFSLSAQECTELMAAAEAASGNATQLHPYIRTVSEQMPPQGRIELIEMLWEVAYADGVLDPEEDALIRRMSNLIHIADRERIFARQRVLARLGLSGTT
jgi:uncharacterized tellurite resistance protein B-like protein